MKLKLVLFGFLLSFFWLPAKTYAVTCDINQPPPSNPDDLYNYILDCQKKVTEKQGQANTLKAALEVINAKIRLTQAQIKQTTSQIGSLEKDVTTLSTVLTDLDKTLAELGKIYLARVRESYLRRDPSPMNLFFSSDSFAKFFTRIRYLAVVKARDQLVLSEMETARRDYDSQKNAKIRKQQEVEELKTKLVNQQVNLAAQQRSKNDLLIQTRNDEASYQRLISRAQEELEAINAIIAKPCRESKTEVRDVGQDEEIAHLIQGQSCNSGGTHLHFIVADKVADKMIVKNPFNYLRLVDYYNCSGIEDKKCVASDPFNPTGSWNWPLSPIIQLNQGYGVTWAVRNTWVGTIYGFHNGLDIIGTANSVRAVQPGKLYRDAYVGNNGCSLQYVCVDHKDSDTDTFYLHINY